MHACTRISDEMREKQEIYKLRDELTVRLKQRSASDVPQPRGVIAGHRYTRSMIARRQQAMTG